VINPRQLVPPSWRVLAGAQRDPWILLAVLAALAGASWILSPAGLAERYVRRPRETMHGRALGYAAGTRIGPTVDPLGVLTTREQLRMGLGQADPTYRARLDPFYLRAPNEWTGPIRPADVRPLAATAPYRQPGPRPAVARTAADVLRPPATEGAA